MFGLFEDELRLGPSLQSLLFLCGAIGSLAALPQPLAELLPDPRAFRIVGASGFHGTESAKYWEECLQPDNPRNTAKITDRFAFRLAGSMITHGPALATTMLSPAFNLSKVMRKPELLAALRQPGTSMRRVPQAADGESWAPVPLHRSRSLTSPRSSSSSTPDSVGLNS